MQQITLDEAPRLNQNAALLPESCDTASVLPTIALASDRQVRIKIIEDHCKRYLESASIETIQRSSQLSTDILFGERSETLVEFSFNGLKFPAETFVCALIAIAMKDGELVETLTDRHLSNVGERRLNYFFEQFDIPDLGKRRALYPPDVDDTAAAVEILFRRLGRETFGHEQIHPSTASIADMVTKSQAIQENIVTEKTLQNVDFVPADVFNPNGTYAEALEHLGIGFSEDDIIGVIHSFIDPASEEMLSYSSKRTLNPRIDEIVAINALIAIARTHRYEGASGSAGSTDSMPSSSPQDGDGLSSSRTFEFVKRTIAAHIAIKRNEATLIQENILNEPYEIECRYYHSSANYLYFASKLADIAIYRASTIGLLRELVSAFCQSPPASEYEAACRIIASRRVGLQDIHAEDYLTAEACLNKLSDGRFPSFGMYCISTLKIGGPFDNASRIYFGNNFLTAAIILEAVNIMKNN